MWRYFFRLTLPGRLLRPRITSLSDVGSFQGDVTSVRICGETERERERERERKRGRNTCNKSQDQFQDCMKACSPSCNLIDQVTGLGCRRFSKDRLLFLCCEELDSANGITSTSRHMHHVPSRPRRWPVGLLGGMPCFWSQCFGNRGRLQLLCLTNLSRHSFYSPWFCSGHA